MNETVLDGDCGKHCNHHCCRVDYEDGERMGVYLMPYEYEKMMKGSKLGSLIKLEKHTNKDYFISPKVKFLYYMFCDESTGCLRESRPIQCRTYPFEPYIENDELYLIIIEDQIHNCPMLDQMEIWRKEFIKGIYLGWKELIQIPKIKDVIAFDSLEKKMDNNIRMKFSEEDVFGKTEATTI